ncbi:putative methyl-binding domain-containing protein 4 [Diplodia seriata]|uniref:Putative methyl-binding domain-containing protein 4 n=1 Tax=Diplodia seriata TaxID=420778 RepID=A0A0G2EU80_9PEZI|nr:putative methyl-binding domain-containing protein 4 [Diplodia seriata]
MVEHESKLNDTDTTLDAEEFGLIQKTTKEPLHLLAATILLNRTHGNRAFPIFHELVARYPTPNDLLLAAPSGEIEDLIKSLGFGRQHTVKLVRLATAFVEEPPTAGVTYRVENRDYTNLREHEIAHLYGVGRYA